MQFRLGTGIANIFPFYRQRQPEQQQERRDNHNEACNNNGNNSDSKDCCFNLMDLSYYLISLSMIFDLLLISIVD